MESCLLTYFVINDQIRSTSDFNPYFFENKKPVYEVLRIEQSIPLFLEDHLERFFQSCHLANLKPTFDESRIKKRLKALITYNNLKTGLIKFIFFKEQEKEFFIAWITPFSFPTKRLYSEGITTAFLHAARKNPQAKFSNLNIRQQADNFIKENKVYEVLLVNKENVLTEGSRSNLFLLQKDLNILFTPHENLVLKGITRKKIIDLAIHEGIDIFESEFKKNELTDFDSAFITGTSPKVLPIKTIEHLTMDVHHPLIQLLKTKYDELIEDYLKVFSW
jgi:branched-chain amino acid aminotransferase